MVYLKPLAVTRHLAYPLALRGSSRGITTRTVAGRRAGDHHTVPVIPVELNWSRYLVCPYGESDWVRSLRAAGTGELSGGGTGRGLPRHRGPSQRAGTHQHRLPPGRRKLRRQLFRPAARPQGSSGFPDRQDVVTEDDARD